MRQQFTGLDQTGLAGEIADLHQTLAIPELLALFESELRTAVRFSSFEFENMETAQHFFRGSQQLHKCRYRLTVMGNQLGQITLTRNTPFNEAEIRAFERALGALAVHLGNASGNQLAKEFKAARISA